MPTILSAKKKYMEKLKTAYEENKHAKGLALFWDLPVDVVSEKPGAKKWRDAFDTDEDRRKRADAWETMSKAYWGPSV